MNQKELNQHDADKDRDGIPDRIDSSYSPPENEQRYASISPAFCDYLQKQDFSFSNGGMDGANMIVVFPKSEKHHFDALKQAYHANCRKDEYRKS